MQELGIALVVLSLNTSPALQLNTAFEMQQKHVKSRELWWERSPALRNFSREMKEPDGDDSFVTSRRYSQWEGNITEMLSLLNILLLALRSWFGLLSYHIEKTVFELIS